jgi:hypothetical protein
VKQLSVLALACPPVLLLGLASTWAQNPLERGKSPAGVVSAGPVYSGHSTDGDLQEALDDALSQAQRGLADSTMISDISFTWDLSGIHGVRGGIMGQQDIWVEVTVR